MNLLQIIKEESQKKEMLHPTNRLIQDRRRILVHSLLEIGCSIYEAQEMFSIASVTVYNLRSKHEELVVVDRPYRTLRDKVLKEIDTDNVLSRIRNLKEEIKLIQDEQFKEHTNATD